LLFYLKKKKNETSIWRLGFNENRGVFFFTSGRVGCFWVFFFQIRTRPIIAVLPDLNYPIQTEFISNRPNVQFFIWVGRVWTGEGVLLTPSSNSCSLLIHFNVVHPPLLVLSSSFVHHLHWTPRPTCPHYLPPPLNRSSWGTPLFATEPRFFNTSTLHCF